MDTDEQPRAAYGPLTALLVSVSLVAVMLTWTYLGMRAVMDVGGSCASGGPYVIAQPCPGGAWMISVAIPVLIIAAMVGSLLAARLSAPTLLLPMWAALFGALGWNFLAYGLGDDGPVWGWIVCGVLFELMALPAVVVMVTGASWAQVPATLVTGARRGPRPAAWYAAYTALGAAGLVLGWWTFEAWS